MKTILTLFSTLLISLHLLAQNTPVTSIFLVRHAEQDKNVTLDPPLNAQGQERVQLLTNTLSKTKIGAAYTTPLLRGKSTALPIAQANEIELSHYKLEDDEKALVKNILETQKGKNILIVGHSGNFADLLNAATLSTNYNDSSIDGFSDLYILTFEGSKPLSVTRLKYGN